MSWRPIGLMAICLAAAWARPAAAADEEEIAATWKRYEVRFHYTGFTTRYSCDGLQDKVRRLLLHAGVRKDLKISLSGCEVGPGRVASMPGLRIVFWAPELPEAGRRDVGEPALARWRRVVMRRNQPRWLEAGDCELVEQFRDRLLPQLMTRAVSSDINCVPYQLVGTRIDLAFEVLEGRQPPDLAGAPVR